jgi:hypothetical protein
MLLWRARCILAFFNFKSPHSVDRLWNILLRANFCLKSKAEKGGKMAKIREKNSKRYRVQITTSKKVWEEYDRNQRLAVELKVEIDLSGDFSVWLARQNEQVAQELQNLKALADADQQVSVETGKTVGSEVVVRNVVAVAEVGNGCSDEHETAADKDLDEAEVDGGDDSI